MSGCSERRAFSLLQPNFFQGDVEACRLAGASKSEGKSLRSKARRLERTDSHGQPAMQDRANAPAIFRLSNPVHFQRFCQMRARLRL